MKTQEARDLGQRIVGDFWYVPDILGERVPGPALVANFGPSLELLVPWRKDDNRWVRRAAGVSVHFWAKRSRGAAELGDKAKKLLNFLKPLFEDWNIDAVKGIGWLCKLENYALVTAGEIGCRITSRRDR